MSEKHQSFDVTFSAFSPLKQVSRIDLGLDRIKLLLSRLGNPHYHVPIIHVAGTNGKGSVCAYLSSILRCAGYRVGRYTSPHLLDWTERICLNDQSIDSDRLQSLFSYVQSFIDPHQDQLTFFELITAVAWVYFSQEKVDLAVMEVGLGGRLDATNVVDRPLASIITSISRDHCEFLGDTLEAIAMEKAGILKPHCPAVIGILPPPAKNVITHKAQTLPCPVTWIKPSQKITENKAWNYYQGEIIEYTLPLAGDIQLINSSIVLTTLEILSQNNWKITPTHIQQGMKETQWLGRLQWVNYQQRSILLDGAHNEDSAFALRRYIDTLNNPVCWIIGMLETKDHSRIFQALLRTGDQLYLVPVPDNHATPPETLQETAKSVCFSHAIILDQVNVYNDLFLALNEAISAHPSSTIVVCGSLYLLGYYLQNTSQ